MQVVLKQSSILVMFVLSLLMAQVSIAADVYQEDAHYTVLETPIATKDESKVEIVEVFWYGCSHCNSFDPIIQAWEPSLPEYVDFVQLPVYPFNGAVSEMHARAYYTAESLDVLDSFHPQFFHAIHQKKRSLSSEGSIREFFEEIGVKEEDFNKHFNSFGIDRRLKWTESRVKGYKVTGVPSMIINGKYKISGGVNKGVKTFDDMLRVAGYLAEKEKALLKDK